MVITVKRTNIRRKNELVLMPHKMLISLNRSFANLQKTIQTSVHHTHIPAVCVVIKNMKNKIEVRSLLSSKLIAMTPATPKIIYKQPKTMPPVRNVKQQQNLSSGCFGLILKLK